MKFKLEENNESEEKEEELPSYSPWRHCHLRLQPHDWEIIDRRGSTLIQQCSECGVKIQFTA